MSHFGSALILSALLVLPAQGKPIQALSDYTRDRVTSLDEAVRQASAVDPGPDGSWAFKRFLLRITAKVGFSVEVINVELLPELELVWQKESAF